MKPPPRTLRGAAAAAHQVLWLAVSDLLETDDGVHKPPTAVERDVSAALVALERATGGEPTTTARAYYGSAVDLLWTSLVDASDEEDHELLEHLAPALEPALEPAHGSERPPGFTCPTIDRVRAALTRAAPGNLPVLLELLERVREDNGRLRALYATERVKARKLARLVGGSVARCPACHRIDAAPLARAEHLNGCELAVLAGWPQEAS